MEAFYPVVGDLTPEKLITAYSRGVFPMAIPELSNALFWFSPDPRCVLPLADFHCPRSLKRRLHQGIFQVTENRVFERVMQECAAPRPEAAESWISPAIIRSYTRLHEQGRAASIEVWHGDRLVGGLYGVVLGGAFFGESMFHRATDASKVALVHLVQRLCEDGFTLLDVQYQTPHLQQFGTCEIPRDEYLKRLQRALALSPDSDLTRRRTS